jgi:hypothetical protein
MKRLFKITGAAIFFMMIPFSLIRGQSQQKIKIITDDGSGKQVVVDTVFTGKSPDSMKLKDGSVVYFKHGSDGSDVDHSGQKKHIYITSTSSDNGKEGNETKEITIVQSDSSYSNNGNKGDVMYYSNSDPDKNGDVKYKVITMNSDEPGDRMKVHYRYSSDSQAPDDTFNVYVSRDDHDSGIDKSRYVIAKDGMVVTIEGNDEAKTKALAKEIETTLGVNGDAGEKEGKSETGKKSKK